MAAEVFLRCATPVDLSDSDASCLNEAARHLETRTALAQPCPLLLVARMLLVAICS